MYAVALVDDPPHYQLFAIDLSDGSIVFDRPFDPPDLNPVHQGQRGALALANGRVYATFGNRSYPSCDPWNGWVVGASASDPAEELVFYKVPSSRAGIWAPGGAAVDPDGNLLVATGDGPNNPGSFPHSESVIKLSPTLQELDFWAPADWAELDRHDIDIGSVSPALLPDLGLVFQGGKNSYGYLLRADHLGGVGGDLYQEQVLPGQCGGIFGGTAYLASLLFVPCGPQIVALQVVASRLGLPAGRPGFTQAWQGPTQTRTGRPTVGSPIVAGGAVWAVDAERHLLALDVLTGEQRFRGDLPGAPARFATPTSGGGRIYATGGHQVVAFNLVSGESD
jgi:outer membrane protein assembly factor BamB